MKYFVELSNDFPNSFPPGRLFHLVEGKYTLLNGIVSAPREHDCYEYTVEFDDPPTASRRNES